METTTAQRTVSRRGEYEIVASGPFRQERLRHANSYSTAMWFVRGKIDIVGDLVAAVRDQLARAAPGWRQGVLNWVCRAAPWRIAELWESKTRSRRHIRFHYDRSNEFYRQFLDSRMVYSCAYFRMAGESARESLDEAQLAKLDHICRKLRLARGERFLDIGCGWGALALRAAATYGATATGCTLSGQQAAHASACVRRDGLAGRVQILERDYRDMEGRFDKIASVGMFEHVGKLRLASYFRKVYDLLEPDGLFLNHGITRPSPVPPDPGSWFIARQVFPGGSIRTLPETIRAAEKAGFAVLDVESLRKHYALTCREWVARLRASREKCLRVVDERTWRTWQLFLAGSAVAFEDGCLDLHQILLAKRGSNRAPAMTREYMYA